MVFFQTLDINQGSLFIINYMLQKGNNTYNVFMLRMALRDIIASVTAFLNCLRKKTNTITTCPNTFQKNYLNKERHRGRQTTYLIARYMGRMANNGNVWTLIMMVMKAMYSRTLMKPGRQEKNINYFHFLLGHTDIVQNEAALD